MEAEKLYTQQLTFLVGASRFIILIFCATRSLFANMLTYNTYLSYCYLVHLLRINPISKVEENKRKTFVTKFKFSKLYFPHLTHSKLDKGSSVRIVADKDKVLSEHLAPCSFKPTG